MAIKFQIVGDTIMMNGVPAATITLAVSSLRDEFEFEIDPDKFTSGASTKYKGKSKDYEEGYDEGYQNAKDDAYVAFC